MAHRHIDLEPLARQAKRETRKPQSRRALVRLDSRHHLEETLRTDASAAASWWKRALLSIGTPTDLD